MAAYGSDAGFAAWLASMGYELPPTAPDPVVLRTRGSSYLDGAYEGHWSGYRTDGVMQELGWPRTNATFNCVSAIDPDAIPVAVVNASYRAAYLDAVTPGVLFGVVATGDRKTKREKVDVIEVEYFDDSKSGIGSGASFIDGDIDGAMNAFICDEADGGTAFLYALGGC